jgi:HEAT repeat protein
VSRASAFSQKLAALDSLRSEPDAPVTQEHLRKALKDRNNYVVARAASVCADLRLDALIPDLLSAFDRFFQNATKSDPRCMAKAEIASALRRLGHHAADAYLRGIAHVQFEPTWGGRADTAATLRGTCALALSECPLDDLEILSYLADLLADPEDTVRVDAARAIEQLNRIEGALLLRLKLLLGDQQPAVMGQCFESLLSLAPPGVVVFLTRFLHSSNQEVQLEAASALAQCRDPQAVTILRQYWQDPFLPDDIRHALLINLGASPLAEAAEVLLEVIAREPLPLASTALTALANSRFQTDFRPRIVAAVTQRDSAQLTSLYAEKFSET